MKVGDSITLRREGWEKSFTIATLVRDAQMNPAFIHSKRFLISEADFATGRAHFPETEYLIGIRLVDPAQVGENKPRPS